MSEGRSTHAPLGADPDESAVIDAFLGCGPRRSALGIGDDAAVLTYEAGAHVVTMDAMVEGTHWDHRLSAEDVGWKLVAVNVSDIAAMGARPRWCTLALTLPRPLDRAWVAAFATGVRAACARWEVELVGGDTTRGAVRVASMTMGGVALRPVLRDGAQVGDDLWVTGTLGRSAEAMLSGSPSQDALAWLRRPQPRLELAATLADAGHVHAMMDVSDGLRADLARLCARGQVGATVDANALPGAGPIAWRTSYGEDWELLFAAPPSAQNGIVAVGRMLHVPLHRIGVVQPAAQGVRLEGHARAPAWPDALFAHFPVEGA